MSFVRPAVTERWDRGHWDVAHWDGQIGLSPPVASITITTKPANISRSLKLLTTTTSIVITPIDVTLHVTAPQFIHAATAPIVISTIDATLLGIRRLGAITAPIVVTPIDATILQFRRIETDTADIIVSGWVNGLNVFRQPGDMEFGWQKVILRRW